MPADFNSGTSEPLKIFSDERKAQNWRENLKVRSSSLPLNHSFPYEKSANQHQQINNKSQKDIKGTLKCTSCRSRKQKVCSQFSKFANESVSLAIRTTDALFA